MNIEARMARLEQRNRTLTWTVGGLLLGLGLVGATAFRPGHGVQRVVRAERFELVSASGKQVGVWDPGQLSVSADDSQHEGWTTVLRADGVLIGAGKGSSWALARLGRWDGGQALVLSSAEGMAVLGSNTVTSRLTGASTRFPVTTLMFLDSSGTVRYQVP